MIECHWEGIASCCTPESRVSLGLGEGLNNKIRVIQRSAYRYRDKALLDLKRPQDRRQLPARHHPKTLDFTHANPR